MDRLLHTFSTDSDVLDVNLSKLKEGTGGITYSDFSEGKYWREIAKFARRMINL